MQGGPDAGRAAQEDSPGFGPEDAAEEEVGAEPEASLPFTGGASFFPDGAAPADAFPASGPAGFPAGFSAWPEAGFSVWPEDDFSDCPEAGSSPSRISPSSPETALLASRNSSICTSRSKVLRSSLLVRRNSATLLPRVLPIWGSFRGPKTMSATTRMMSISCMPRGPIISGERAKENTADRDCKERRTSAVDTGVGGLALCAKMRR